MYYFQKNEKFVIINWKKVLGGEFMKKFSLKIILGLLFICILAIGTINPIKVSAKDINPYKTIMEEYLNAFKNFDIDTIVKISKDK